MAYSFTSASSQYLEAGSSPISNYPLALSAWAYMASTAASIVVAAFCKNGANDRHQLFYNAGTARWEWASVNADGSVDAAQGTSAPSAGQWYHLFAVVASATSRNLWVNGVQQTGSTVSITTSGLDRLLVGARRNATGVAAFWNGQLADVGFWSVANHTAGEIAGLAKGLSSVGTRPQSLKSYHPLVRNNVAPIGPAFTAYNAPTVAAHPRIFYPAP